MPMLSFHEAQAFCEAMRRGDLGGIRRVLDSGVSPNDVVFDSGGTAVQPLVAAISSNQEEAALLLMKSGADIHATTGADGETPLHLASAAGMRAVVQALLTRGSNMEAKTIRGETALCSAVSRAHTDIVALLLSHGAAVNVPMTVENRYDGHASPSTPLLQAFDLLKSEALATMLIDAGADWSGDAIFEGRMGLHRAARHGFSTLFRKLIDERGADIRMQDSDGRTCLFDAVLYGRLDIVQFLLDRGLSPHDQDKKGETVLFAAVSSRAPGAMEAAKLLLELGVDVNHKTPTGLTPLHAATRAALPGMAVLVIEAGGHVTDDDALDADLALVLTRFIRELFASPSAPIPLFPRTIRWAMSASPTVDRLLRRWHISLSLAGTAESEAEAEEMRRRRLMLINGDAWERRKHLVIDRALDWGYGD